MSGIRWPAAEGGVLSRAAYRRGSWSRCVDGQWIALLPGSREKEVNANLYTMLQAAILLSKRRTGSSSSCRWLRHLSVAWLQTQIDRWAVRRKHFGGAPLPKLRLVQDAAGRAVPMRGRAWWRAGRRRCRRRRWVESVCGGVPGVGADVSAREAAGAVPAGDAGGGGCRWQPADCDGQPGGRADGSSRSCSTSGLPRRMWWRRCGRCWRTGRIGRRRSGVSAEVRKRLTAPAGGGGIGRVVESVLELLEAGRHAKVRNGAASRLKLCVGGAFSRPEDFSWYVEDFSRSMPRPGVCKRFSAGRVGRCPCGSRSRSPAT